MKKLLLILVLMSIHYVKAQDIHFTMYDAFLTNPATVGIFNGDVRGTLNYKNQWASVGAPFKTYAATLEGSLFKNRWKNAYLGIGGNIYRDVAGQSKMGTTKLTLALSSVVKLDHQNNASIGVMGSWAQNSISPENLRWGSQFNGQFYDPSINANETFSNESGNYFDFSAGALWTYKKNISNTYLRYSGFNMQAGLAFYHAGRPTQPINFSTLDKLYSRYVFHSEAHIGVAKTKIAFVPKIITHLQGPSREITGGLLIKYMINEGFEYRSGFSAISLSFGGYYRIGDAFAPSFELEIDNFAFGFSYDLTLSELRAANNSRGGPEFFIRIMNPNRKVRSRFN